MSNDLALGHVIKTRGKKTHAKRFTLKSYKDQFILLTRTDFHLFHVPGQLFHFSQPHIEK